MPADPDMTNAVEQRLRVQERQLAMIFNSARDMMMLVKVEPGVLFRVVSVNREYLNKVHSVGFRFTAEDFAGKTCDEVLALFGFPAAAAAAIRARYAQVIESREVLAYDEDKSGPAGVFHGRTTITPLLDDSGRCAFVLYATQDITALKLAELERSRSEQMLRAILDHSFQFIGLLDPEGRLLRPNQTSLDAVGVSREEVVGKYFWETPWWTHSAEEQARLREAVGRAARGEFVRYETTHPTAGGRMLTIDFSLKPVRDERGKVVAIIPEGRDMTERKTAEQALRESEEKFAKAFRASPQAMSIASMEDGRYLEINQAHQELFGFRPEEIVGRTPAELGILVDPDATAKGIEQVRTTGRVREMSLRVRTRDGRILNVINNAELVRVGGRECALLTTRDVTAQLCAEQALRESEEKFAKAFKSSPDAISVHELESGRYVEVNDGFLRLFGGSREEIIGRTPLELGVWAEAVEREAFVSRLRSEGSVRQHFVKVCNHAGEIRLCELSAEVFEVGGRPHNVTVLRDVTEQRRAEQALRESEETFARAFRASPDAISISELASGRLIDINEGFEKLSGYTRAELIGHTAEELGLWAEEGGRDRLAEGLRRHGSVRNLQMRVQNRSGEQGDFLVSGETVEIGGRKCLVIVAHDIRDRLRAEQALRESEEKFARAFQSSPMVLTIAELETGRFVEVNDAFERLSGHTRAEAIGRTSMELGLWRNEADRQPFAHRLKQEGRVRDLEMFIIAKGGRELILRANSDVVQLGGRACILSVLEDITEQRADERRRAEVEAQMRQNQKLEALGTLAGGIAHDFNNILTAIIVNQELAQMDIGDADSVQRRLGEIGQASTRAKDLVRQILTFSRQQSHEKLRQHLQMIVREALGLLRASLPATIEIVQDLSPDTPPVLADGSQIHQVVMNLCTNAAHAMRDRPGRLTVRLACRDLDEAAARSLPGLRPGRYAQLTVTDTGHGMEAAVLARIFEPFFTTKGPGEGTGLGLPMVHGIMKEHEGGIFVQSTPGKGTAFDLYFPAAEENNPQAPVPSIRIARGRGEPVLVVDDEESISGAVGTMLDRIGYRVTTFNDPQAALEHFRAAPGHYALLLTDRTMPRLSGPELIAEARKLRPDLPALMMSGLNSADVADGADYGLVAKPIDIVDLSQTVRHSIDARPNTT